MNIIEELKAQYRIGGFAQRLIFWNVGLFAIPLILLGILSLFNISFNYLNFFELNSSLDKLIFKPWSIITYGFFHADFFHLLFNMIVLNFSAQLFHTFFKEKQFIDVYFTGLIFSGIVFIISSYVFPAFNFHVPLIGASGAIMTILIATTTYSPNFSIRLFLFGQVKLWHIALVFIVIDFIQLSSNNSRGHIAHLGGALFGYLYVTQIKNGKNIAIPFNRWYFKIRQYFITSTKKDKIPFRNVYKNEQKNTPTSNQIKNINQKKIDDILDKISANGYDSLTKEEKEFLFNTKP